MKFEGKVVIITGAGKGIGCATARAFANEGAHVVCNSITDSGRAVAESIGNRYASLFLQGDVSDEKMSARIVAETVRKFGKIDILFNNAGIVIPGTLDQTKIPDWDRVMSVNVRSAFLMSMHAFPYLARTKGVIINNASSVALKGVAERFAYTASKGAILSMTRSMAVDCLKHGIRVNCICPGTTDTPSLAERIMHGENPERAREELKGRQPMGRFGTPEEIAEGVLYLAGATFCTGIHLSIDGGMTT